MKTGDYKTKGVARDALVAIGPDAIPALREALNDSRSLNWAAFALASIGKEGLPVLLDALTNGPLAIRQEIAGAGVMQVSALLPYEKEILPVLVECMRNENRMVRAGAVNALQSFWKQPEIVMPTLMDCLTDTNAGVRGSAVTVIRKFGRDADPALSVLVRIAKEDADSYVKTRAAESLRVLAPQRADQEGL
ncbi:MAG TPA: HEAT repeat domain-containing protein [Candidatus Acidoferrum sp.]|nr:HEAT repeat domain-containing protein [Candidatus Acidoferrum sp.]